jgi:cobalamin biosynthetic protein CobC
VVINPNNPTGLSFSAEKLMDWAEQMPEGGYLIIDEAFIDLKPEQSLLSDYDAFTRLNNLWVLRSFGKFFGLAGVRLGFLFGPSDLLKTISEHLGPWAVNGPAQAVSVCALNDRAWQQTARMRIQQNSDAMLELFKPLFHKVLCRGEDLIKTNMSKMGNAGLFNSGWIASALANQLYDFFAQRGVLVRVIEGSDLAPQRVGYSLLRLGIVDKNDAGVTEKLQQVISEYILTLD